MSWHQQRERLLRSRISDLNLRTEGSEIERDRYVISFSAMVTTLAAQDLRRE